MVTKTVQLRDTPKFIPAHVRGDKDFKGHGPRVNSTVRLRVKNGNQLWATVWMRAKETKRDYTTAEGSADYFVYDGGSDGVERITRIISDPFSSVAYTDTDHQADHVDLPGHELVDKFIFTGDTRGKEAGIRTGVTLKFNPVEFEYEETPDDPRVVTITDIEPTPKFVPPHVGGDRDFKGHGPIVDVSARISVENDYEIWARVWMRAIESKSDYTEVSGSTRFMIHRHNKKIARILSDVQSATTYRDNDHQNDYINMAAGELVKAFVVTGDTRGNEAGSRTGVVVYFNPIRLLLAE